MTSRRKASTSRSLAVTVETLPPTRAAVAGWAECSTVTVFAFAVAPLTARPAAAVAAARAVARATRCNFLMTSSFMLGRNVINLTVQVDRTGKLLEPSSHKSEERPARLPPSVRRPARLGGGEGGVAAAWY